VIEATNSNQSAQQAVISVRPGGRVILIGLSGHLTTVDLDRIVLNDISIRGSLSSPHEWKETIKFIEEKKFDPSEIITHKIPLSKFESAIELLNNKADGVVKVILKIE